jgi:hypothetical protein
MTKQIKTISMRTSGVQHLLERTYREGGVLQWVRETTQNAIEAGATRIEYGIEWQALAAKGVARRTISDNGRGMTATQLVKFLNTFGGGAKAIGGTHENFGVGAKTSLLPWNRHGLVAVSWVAGQAAMVWLHKDAETGEYGLRELPNGPVSSPFVDAAHGCDWAKVKPSWIKEHGTVLVLLGDSAKDDTVRGDPERDESDLKGIAAYLNRRFWDVPAGVEIVVEELRTNTRADWPRRVEEAHGPEPKSGVDRRTNRRTVTGARYFVEYPVASFKKGALDHHGTMTLEDKTRVHWYLWKGERPGVQSYGLHTGSVSTLYHGELYDQTAHLSVYRAFGITASDVRSRTWIVIEPAPYDEKTKRGVYPRTDRNALLLAGAGGVAGPPPMHTWAAEFAERMPDALVAALRDARGQEGTVTDEAWRERLAERIGSRWRIDRVRAGAGGDARTLATSGGEGNALHVTREGEPAEAAEGGEAGESREADPQAGTQGDPEIGPTTKRGRRGDVMKIAGGIPIYRLARADEVDPGMAAAWVAHAPEHPEGLVLLNAEHPVIAQQVKYWSKQYASHLAEEVAHQVVDVYGQAAVAAVAHSEHLRGILPPERIDDDLRSDAALTMALLGLVREDAMIAARLGAKLGTRKRVAA